MKSTKHSLALELMETKDDQTVRLFFVGKIIGDTFYREFEFGTAVLWQTRELSMDKRVYDFIKDKVKTIVFTDTGEEDSFKIGILKFKNHMRIDNYGALDQCYIKKDILKHLPKMIKTPYIKNKKVLEDNYGQA